MARVAVLGATLEDGRTAAARAGVRRPVVLSVNAPDGGRGLTLDECLCTVAAVRHPRFESALEVIVPALLARER